jgi:hypothetical protein
MYAIPVCFPRVLYNRAMRLPLTQSGFIVGFRVAPALCLREFLLRVLQYTSVSQLCFDYIRVRGLLLVAATEQHRRQQRHYLKRLTIHSFLTGPATQGRSEGYQYRKD